MGSARRSARSRGSRDPSGFSVMENAQGHLPGDLVLANRDISLVNSLERGHFMQRQDAKSLALFRAIEAKISDSDDPRMK